MARAITIGTLLVAAAVSACDSGGRACEPLNRPVVRNPFDAAQAEEWIAYCLQLEAYKLARADLSTAEITASVLQACERDIAVRNKAAAEDAEREHQAELAEWRATAPARYASLTREEADRQIRAHKANGGKAFPGRGIPAYVLADVRPGDPGWQDFLRNGVWGPALVENQTKDDWRAEAHRRVVEAKAGRCWRRL